MKVVTVKLDPLEERMVSLLAAKYGGSPDARQVIRRAFINECVRYGFDLKAMVQDLDEANPA